MKYIWIVTFSILTTIKTTEWCPCGGNGDNMFSGFSNTLGMYQNIPPHKYTKESTVWKDSVVRFSSGKKAWSIYEKYNSKWLHTFVKIDSLKITE